MIGCGAYLVLTLYLLDWFPEHASQLGMTPGVPEKAWVVMGIAAQNIGVACDRASRWRRARTQPCIRTV
ncbi:MAG: hypothetical protein ACLQU1_22855 [Bryobacteraceae bacterium]